MAAWDHVQGTNMVHGLMIARKLLAKARGANKQIIMITDGGPTVWQEGGRWVFDWPPPPEAILQTLREVKRCAHDGVLMNVFMLWDDPVPQALRQPDGECEPWPRLLHEPRFPWRVFAGRLSGEQAETGELGRGCGQGVRMSDEIEAIKRSDVTFQLTALQIPASQAARMARSLRSTAGGSRASLFFPTVYLFAMAAITLWLAWSFGRYWYDTNWLLFWFVIVLAFVWIPVSIWSAKRRDANIQPAFYLHRGILALREAAVSGDDRLAPAVPYSVEETPESGAEVPLVGGFQRVGAQFRGIMLLVMGVVLTLFAASILGGWPVDLSFSDTSILNLRVIASTVFLIEGVWLIIVAVQLLRPFEITTEEQGVRWRQSTFRRRTVRVPWQDVRAFVTFRASKDGKTGSDQDEIFLLDATKYVVAWRITPKSSQDERKANEGIVRNVSEHIQLRDITASLKELLESPETRSYEYSVAMLSVCRAGSP